MKGPLLERTTIYVDTSYLLASFYNSWEEGAREQLEVSLSNVVQTLAKVARGQVNQPIHRQFWYDGVPENGPHRYQRTLRVIDGVILRTGQLIEWGSRRSQKAVDTRLVADMVLHAVRGQCTDMVLVSGDADMIPGVEAAVEAGVRVHLVGFGWDSISSALRNACDSTTVLEPRTDFADSMQIRVLEGPLPPQVRRPRPAMPGEAEVGEQDDPVDMEEVDFRAERAKDDSVAQVRERLSAERAAADSAADAPLDDDPARDSAAGPASDGATAGRAAGMPGESGAQDDPEAISRPATERAEPTSPAGDGLADADMCPEDEPTIPDAEDAAGTPAPVRPASRVPTPRELADGEVLSRKQADAAAQAEREEAAADAAEAAMEDGATGSARVRVTRTEVTVTAGTEGVADTESGEAGTDGESTEGAGGSDAAESEAGERPVPRPSPSMMATRRRPLRSRYVPLTEEVWSSSGEPTPYDVGQQYATWWFSNAADDDQRGEAHTLTGGALPPEVDRPLLQFACQTLHEFTLNEFQRVALRDGFHEGIRAIIMRR